MDKKRIEAAVTEILLAIGEDPAREGLVETPRRVANMYAEIFSGLEKDPKEFIKLFNEENNDEMVVVRDIPLYSMCEHHLLPFVGKAHIVYIPAGGQVIGLSKLARIVDNFARRPQLQERLTAQISIGIHAARQNGLPFALFRFHHDQMAVFDPGHPSLGRFKAAHFEFAGDAGGFRLDHRSAVIQSRSLETEVFFSRFQRDALRLDPRSGYAQEDLFAG